MRVQSTTSNSSTVSSMQQCRMKSHRIGHQSTKRQPIQAYLYIKTKNKPLKMTNSTSTDVIFTDAWCDRMVAKHQNCHSPAPADKQINEHMVHPTSPLRVMRRTVRSIPYNQLNLLNIQLNNSYSVIRHIQLPSIQAF